MTAGAAATSGTGRLRVASFNIHHGATTAGRVSLGGLGDACVALDADVLGLQEVDKRRMRSGLRDQGRVAARRLGASHVYATAVRRHVVGCYGNALVVRGRVSDVEVRTLPGTGTRERRVAIVARATVRDTAITVAVAHLQHHPRHLRHLADEAPEQLAAVLDWLRERPAPRVLLADCNLQPARAEPILAAAGFEAAATGPTFPADSPRMRLDYVAVQGCVVESAGLGDVPAVGDHLPVIAVLGTVQSLP